MSVRRWYIDQALKNFPTLVSVLAELTEEEVLHCLDLEAATLRRRSVIDRLISRAVRLRELSYSRQLKEKFHGTSQVRFQHDPGRTEAAPR
jgi:hypothetical protein